METLRMKWGPLPVWGWLALITVLALGWYLIKGKSGSTASTSDQETSDQAPEIVVQTGDQGTQSTTPPAAPSLTAAQSQELSEIPGDTKQIKKEEGQIAHLNRRTGIAPKKKSATPKPGRKPAAGTASTTAAKLAAAKPAAKASTAKTAKISKPKASTSKSPARHLATSHATQD